MSGPIQQNEASVGILIGVREGDRPAVLLQVRADHDTYARACQVTTHGQLTADELKLDESTALGTALGRKLREEIGGVAAEMVEASKSPAVLLDRTVNQKGELIVTYGKLLEIQSAAFQALIVPGVDVAGFRTCTDPSSILPLDKTHKARGVDPSETRMFKDEIVAVTEFFRRITS